MVIDRGAWLRMVERIWSTVKLKEEERRRGEEEERRRGGEGENLRKAEYL